MIEKKMPIKIAKRSAKEHMTVLVIINSQRWKEKLYSGDGPRQSSTRDFHGQPQTAKPITLSDRI